MSESELIDYCRQNREFAQRELFEMYYKPLYHLAFRYLSDHHLTEDVLSVSFTKAFRKIDRFSYQGKGSFKKWLNTIVINESIRLLRKRRKMANSEILYEDLPENIEIQNYEAELDVEMFYHILSEMPPMQRVVFNLFNIEGYSHKEITAKLNITEGNSKTLLSRAKSHIRQKLENQNNHEKEIIYRPSIQK